jgi:Zn-dependent peptidase ImmA (M78 family)
VAPRRIESAVQKVLLENGVHAPPVPVEDIARRLGAEVRYSPYEGELSGMVYRDGERIVVGVNSLHHPNRQRFTIAHELGHLLLHRGKEVHIDRTFRVNLRDDVSSKAVDREEIEANTFAAELLMPRAMLSEDMGSQQIDYESEEALAELAKRYRVSLQAMTFRLANLGLVTLQ